MINRIQHICNSPFCEISMFIITGGLFASAIFTNENETSAATASTLIAAIALFSLLIWATIMLIKNNRIKEMSTKPRVIVEICSSTMFLLWLCISSSYIFALIWSPFFIWNCIRSVKQAYVKD